MAEHKNVLLSFDELKWIFADPPGTSGLDVGTFYTAQNWLSLSTTFPRKHEALK